MSWLRFLHRKRSDAELQEEIESYLTEETADNVARGMSLNEARREARLKFGNAQKVRESLWEQNCPQPLTRIARDVRYASRTLSRTPGFSIIAITVMALCIGSATCLFTIVRSVLLRPLPFRDPDRLVIIGCLRSLEEPCAYIRATALPFDRSIPEIEMSTRRLMKSKTLTCITA